MTNLIKNTTELERMISRLETKIVTIKAKICNGDTILQYAESLVTAKSELSVLMVAITHPEELLQIKNEYLEVIFATDTMPREMFLEAHAKVKMINRLIR